MKKIVSLFLCISLLSASTIAFSANETETDAVVFTTDETDVITTPTPATATRVSVTATVS